MAAQLSLLIVGAPIPETFADYPGIKVQAVQTPEEAALIEKRPDIFVLVPDFEGEVSAGPQVSQWMAQAGLDRFRFAPGLFCAVPATLSAEDRLEILEAGVDRLVSYPLLPDEIRVKARICQAKDRLAQQQHSDSRALAKSFGYLDRFKSELKALKKELVEEKTSLNAALKQIQEMAAERSRMKSNLSELKKSLQDNIEGFGHLLTILVRARVEKSRGHGEQVAGIAEYLGREMGLDENRLDDLSKAAMLHEVGRLFMSQAYLADKEQKENGPMSAYDSTMMMQYPVKGAELLSSCPGFDRAARIIRSLNEWSDGTGYPEGIKRRHILLESRILAGADELATLKDDPDVRDAEGLLAGLEEMAGSRLDPVVVGLLGKYVVTRMSPETFKVRGVGIEQLEPGMTLGTALFTATGTKLFSANTALTREFIDKIIQYSREYPVDEIVYIKV